MGEAVSHSSLPKCWTKTISIAGHRGLDNIENWVQVELDELEQVYIAEVNLTCAEALSRRVFQPVRLQKGLIV